MEWTWLLRLFTPLKLLVSCLVALYFAVSVVFVILINLGLHWAFCAMVIWYKPGSELGI